MLITGSNKLEKFKEILESLRQPFLLVDDGPIIDSVELHSSHTIKTFDPSEDSFNPVTQTDYSHRKSFVGAIRATFERKNATTLTEETGFSYIRRALKQHPDTLENLIPAPDKKSTPGHVWAYDRIDELLDSPVLKSVLCHDTDFTFTSRRGKIPTILARLDRTVLEEKPDCFFLAQLFFSRYKGLVVVPDFDFYGSKLLLPRIRRNLLIAGVDNLSESEFRNDLLRIPKKIPVPGILPEDAETLADYLSGERRGSEGHTTAIELAMKGIVAHS